MRLFLIVLMTCVHLFSQEVHADEIDINCDLGSLKGSRYSQLRQNLEADRIGLVRIEDSKELRRLKREGLLIKITKIPNVRIDKRLPRQYHYVLPWAANFLRDFGNVFQENFESDFPISSAVRTVKRQKQIAESGNGNAAPARGETRSAHLTGAAIDIPKLQLTREQIAWLRNRLSELELQGRLEATEEIKQPVFHVMVYKDYTPETVRVVLR